jgi:hypothetical protein
VCAHLIDDFTVWASAAWSALGGWLSNFLSLSPSLSLSLSLFPFPFPFLSPLDLSPLHQDAYLSLIDEARRRLPGLAISTDIISG